MSRLPKSFHIASLFTQFDRCHEGCVRKVKKVDDNILLSGGWDKKVKMWDMRSGRNVATKKK